MRRFLALTAYAERWFGAALLALGVVACALLYLVARLDERANPALTPDGQPRTDA